ncbi:hypothetical protein CPAR01_04687 [Colletotrichum paranaense]|uniref:Uncharacterized protein n=1 Tax=Colletotrichum paranaense TaxID=1914294 RepID=A0ABQ9SX19_9PEZI|nr:uncharacterized protein CPAR01_04687 [Colletotrichum paranaense]KAK1544054.1 hypothetical protein CPAR01_04687 [Colletotrichum paranaense]
MELPTYLPCYLTSWNPICPWCHCGLAPSMAGRNAICPSALDVMMSRPFAALQLKLPNLRATDTATRGHSAVAQSLASYLTLGNSF